MNKLGLFSMGAALAKKSPNLLVATMAQNQQSHKSAKWNSVGSEGIHHKTENSMQQATKEGFNQLREVVQKSWLGKTQYRSGDTGPTGPTGSSHRFVPLVRPTLRWAFFLSSSALARSCRQRCPWFSWGFIICGGEHPQKKTKKTAGVYDSGVDKFRTGVPFAGKKERSLPKPAKPGKPVSSVVFSSPANLGCFLLPC